MTNHPSCDTIRVSRGDVLIPLSVGQHLHRTGTAQKNVKNLLTNPHPCDIIRVQMRDARRKPARWQDPRESDKPLTIKSSTARGVGVRNTNVNQTVQAETMSRISLLPQATGWRASVFSLHPFLSLNCKRLGFCPPPMNGVECQRIHDIGGRGFFSFTRPPLSFSAERPRPRRSEFQL